jgi:hypothetical protein
MRLKKLLTESPFGDIMDDWRTKNRKNVKWGFIENDVRGFDIGQGTIRFELTGVDPNWFEKTFVKGKKGVKSSEIKNGMVFVKV